MGFITRRNSKDQSCGTPLYECRSFKDLSFPSDEKSVKGTDIRLDIKLETPIIVIPESMSSKQVLVAQLGNITLNMHESRLLHGLSLMNGINFKIAPSYLVDRIVRH